MAEQQQENKVLKGLFAFDTVTEYKYGLFVWLGFYLPSMIILLADSATGPARDYLTTGSLLSVLSYLIYGYYFHEGRPASTAGQVALSTESLGRWILAAHYGPSNIVSSGAIGGWNGFLLAVSGLFLILKLATQIYLNFNHQEYLRWEQAHRVGGVNEAVTSPSAAATVANAEEADVNA